MFMNTRHLMTNVLLALVLLIASVATVSAQSEESSITVEGASLKDETTLVIPAAVIAVDGWIVVHDSDADGNIVAPAIISEPVALSAGSHEAIEITLTDAKADGDKVFPMLHIDAGVIGTYEFPGADTPVRNGEDTVVVPLTLAAAEAETEETSTPDADSSITVSEMADLAGTTVMVPSATIAQDGWIVIHDSDADGNIVAPAIISEPVALKAGTTTDIAITLTNDITDEGHKVFAMLHIDAGVVGTYEFPGADAPVTNGEDVVVVPFQLKLAAAAPTTMPTTGTSNTLAVTLFAAAALLVVGGLVARRRAA
jgi:LPXTG-motif cell wall-anchored protein